MALCVWTAVHLNIPARGEKAVIGFITPQFIRKIKWLFIGLLAPEFVSKGSTVSQNAAQA